MRIDHQRTHEKDRSFPTPRRPGALVFASGFFTTLLVFLLMKSMRDGDWPNLMLVFLIVIPVGAFLIGLMGGSGYALAAYFLNAKPGKSFLWSILLIGGLSYILIHFFTFKDLVDGMRGHGPQITFFDWYRATTEAMQMRMPFAKEGMTLGKWGYVFRLLEFTGFSVGVAAPCVILAMFGYCGSCRKYFKPYARGFVNSEVLVSDWKKRRRAERPAFLRAAIDLLHLQVQPALELARLLPLADLKHLLDSACDRAVSKKAVARVSIAVRKCPGCDSHHVAVSLVHINDDGKSTSSIIANCYKSVDARPEEGG